MRPEDPPDGWTMADIIVAAVLVGLVLLLVGVGLLIFLGT